jgi:colanic acid biosynthesis glycosyl transferase WcaI
VIIGTDPVFAVLVALPCRLFRPRAKIVHWCFDVYPDAAVAEGVVAATSWPVRALSGLMAAAYRRCEFIADLGPCMARRVAEIAPEVRCVTITPWALVEPESPPAPDREARAALFGDARLGLLYSGSFGRAHSHLEFLELARALRNRSTSQDADPGIVFCFAGRGHRTDELRAAVTDADENIRFAGFAPEAELERRLTACDIHLVSLRPDWTGTVEVLWGSGGGAGGGVRRLAGLLDRPLDSRVPGRLGCDAGNGRRGGNRAAGAGWGSGATPGASRAVPPRVP